MLTEISISNFAIIEQLKVSFDEGLTVLTGETGAGKSIIIDAVQLLVGGRGSQEFVRYGAKKAELQGLFTIEPSHPVLSTLLELGIETEEGMLILSRDIYSNGKTVCRVNGKMVTIAILREIGARLIDIHGQHENQELMHEARHIHLLDRFAGSSFQMALQSYRALYEQYRKLKTRLEKANENEQQIAHRIDLYSFQLQEIDQAQLTVGEEEELEQEKRSLQHFHRLFERLTSAYESISGDLHALDWVGTAMSDLEDATQIDSTLTDFTESVTSSFYALQETAFEIKNRIDTMEYHPERLDEIENRLALLLNLKRKYGKTIEDILQYRDKIEDELERLLHRDERYALEQEKLAHLKQDLEVEANDLSILREQTAKKLEQQIMLQLQQLHMERAQFSVHLEKRTNELFDINGQDDVIFLISTNAGEPMKPLVKVASGGEMSRVMLALKTIFSKHQGITSLIFDEVDTGVSGRVAQAIAEKISMIALHSQVLCISHLPQVAAMADHHYVIRKEVKADRTRTIIQEMSENERPAELSRMLSGAEVTPLTMQHAEELLQLANERKKNLIN